MSIQDGPDLPMMIDDPAKFRDEQVRRKAAERERDDLAKQAERLIEENEELRNRIARLDTWLGEANRFKEAAQNEADDLRANVATLVEQLGEADESRRAALLQLWEMERRCAEALAALTYRGGNEPNQNEAERILRGGAARPVVEPRDEPSKRATAAEYLDDIKATEGCSCDTCFFAPILADRIRKAIAGYAPHPSGTEGPLREAAERADAILAAREPCHSSPPCNDHAAITAARAHLRAALAASPPDGTAPERVRESELLIERLHLADAELAQAERKLEFTDDATCSRVVRARQCLASATRLARQCATRPPDGTPGEPAFQPVDGDHSVPDDGDDGIHDDWQEPRPAAPPTVPREPPARENRHVDHWAHIECVLNGPAIVFSDRAIEQARGARCRHGYRWRDESPAAPPAPPLTPERAPTYDIAPERAPDDRAVIVSIRDGLAKHFEEEAEEYADDEGIREGLLKAAELLRTTGMVAAEYGTATRPPDGMPGEPDSDENIARRGHKAMAKAIAESRTPISPMVLMDAQDPPPRQPGRLISATPLGAAPPTVPGEPPRDVMGRLHDAIDGALRWALGVGPFTPFVPPVAAPPAPPLTPERVPLDEAAPNVESVGWWWAQASKGSRWEVLFVRYGECRTVHGERWDIGCTAVWGPQILPPDPRRSEGAG